MSSPDNTPARTKVARAAFLASTGLLVYTLVGYPLLVAAVSRLKPRPVRKSWDGGLPSVTVIIAAYNEEAAIAAKLDNTFALDYPAELLEVIVASDCSSDSTDDIVRAHSRYGDDWGQVRVCRLPKRGGKTAGQNNAVLHARGEILLFSDATSMYRPDVVKALVSNFADPGVGCAAGRLVYVNPGESSTGQGTRSYWEYETFIKTGESNIFSLIGVSGCMYAVRRSAYRPLPPEASSDFCIATEMVRQNLRAVLEPSAVCEEETNRRASREFSMRTRIITQTYHDLWRMRDMLNPLRSGFYAVQLISHKIFRYALPVFLGVSVLSSASLSRTSRLHRILFSVQTLFATVAAFSSILDRTPFRGHKLAKIFAVPRYFLVSNAVPLVALWKVLRGERYATWDTKRVEELAEKAAG